jgi:hypothetical protein
MQGSFRNIVVRFLIALILISLKLGFLRNSRYKMDRLTFLIARIDHLFGLFFGVGNASFNGLTI